MHGGLMGSRFSPRANPRREDIECSNGGAFTAVETLMARTRVRAGRAGAPKVSRELLEPSTSAGNLRLTAAATCFRDFHRDDDSRVTLGRAPQERPRRHQTGDGW